jgi:hypothetical protein
VKNQTLTTELEDAYLRDMTLDRICNSWERILEMLTNLHADFTAPKNESEVTGG